MQNKHTSIGYEGHISISVQKGNCIIRREEFHNAGRLPLFEFLSKCLAGRFSKELQPSRIRLYKREVESIADDSFDDDCAISSYYTYVNAPAIERAKDPETGDAQEAYIVTYHFRIPCAYIMDLEHVAIGKLGLYSSKNTQGDTSAEHILKKPFDLSEYTGKNYLLLIDWKLKISNTYSIDDPDQVEVKVPEAEPEDYVVPEADPELTNGEDGLELAVSGKTGEYSSIFKGLLEDDVKETDKKDLIIEKKPQPEEPEEPEPEEPETPTEPEPDDPENSEDEDTEDVEEPESEPDPETSESEEGGSDETEEESNNTEGE